ncbi:MAG: glycosyltransferase family 9 protein [Chloroflexales bacterium]|nr:glycosyltransferase family 9 protein [Chloroflexales bacterium]
MYRALFLGDLVVSLPAFRALQERFPSAEITLIGLPWANDFVARTPYIDRLLPFPGYPGINEVAVDPARTAQFLAEAHANPYDLALQMHGDGSMSNGFVAELGARHTLGYCRPGDERLDILLPYVDEENEVGRWLRLANAELKNGSASAMAERGGASRDNPTQPCLNPQCSIPPLATLPAEQARAAALLAQLSGDGPLVALHTGAKDPARRWPAERFAAVGDALAAHYGARLVLTGSASERDITAAAQRHMRAIALDLAGETDLGTFIAVIAGLDLLLTNDTGASHLASTAGTSSVTLFGPSRPEQWAPPNREVHRLVDSVTVTGAAPQDALALLPVGPVLAACEEALAIGGWRQTGQDALLASEVGGQQSAVGGQQEAL